MTSRCTTGVNWKLMLKCLQKRSDTVRLRSLPSQTCYDSGGAKWGEFWKSYQLPVCLLWLY